jgi:hypothetical protein
MAEVTTEFYVPVRSRGAYTVSIAVHHTTDGDSDGFDARRVLKRIRIEDIQDVIETEGRDAS